jgi:hypothetical protein
MAVCETCGKDQFPFDSKQIRDEKGVLHWFCSLQCVKDWQKAPPAPEKPSEPAKEVQKRRKPVSRARKSP